MSSRQKLDKKVANFIVSIFLLLIWQIVVAFAMDDNYLDVSSYKG